MQKDQLFYYRSELASWICQATNFNVFVTLTLKQGLVENGYFRSLKRDDCVRTAWLFRDRLTQKIIGKTRRRRGEKIPIAAFVEGDNVTRLHLHFVATRPTEMTLERFQMAVCSAAVKLDWIHDRIDTRPITYNTAEAVVRYCLETGTDAFLPEASCLRV